MIVDDTGPLGNIPLRPSNPSRQTIEPIFEGDDFGNQPPELIQTQQQLQKQQQQQFRSIVNAGAAAMDQSTKQQKSSSKQSLKGSRVSFEKQPADNSSGEDDDTYENRRGQFQQQRTISGVDHKGILKVSNMGELGT